MSISNDTVAEHLGKIMADSLGKLSKETRTAETRLRKGFILLKLAQQNVRKKYRDKVEVHIRGGFTLIKIPS